MPAKQAAIGLPSLPKPITKTGLVMTPSPTVCAATTPGAARRGVGVFDRTQKGRRHASVRRMAPDGREPCLNHDVAEDSATPLAARLAYDGDSLLRVTLDLWMRTPLFASLVGAAGRACPVFARAPEETMKQLRARLQIGRRSLGFPHPTNFS